MWYLFSRAFLSRRGLWTTAFPQTPMVLCRTLSPHPSFSNSITSFSPASRHVGPRGAFGRPNLEICSEEEQISLKFRFSPLVMTVVMSPSKGFRPEAVLHVPSSDPLGKYFSLTLGNANAAYSLVAFALLPCHHDTSASCSLWSSAQLLCVYDCGG